MKLSTILLLVVCLQVSARGYAQITLREKRATLEKVIKEVKKQTGMFVMYQDQLLQKGNLVDVTLNNVTLEQALMAIFKNQPMTYEIVGDKIIHIKEKAERGKNGNADKIEKPAGVIDVYGVVQNQDGIPLTGASVKVQGMKIGATANSSGNFKILVIPENATLEVSYVGYQTATIPVNGKTYIVVTLAADVQSLNEIVVNKGFYTEKQKYSLSSVSTVKSNVIETQPVSNILQALQGQVPGLNILSSNGMPGARSLVQIRGQNTLSSRPDNVLSNFDQPLIIVDGVPLPLQNNPLIGFTMANANGTSYWQNLTGLSALNGINPLDVESVSVLKDADATSIYGSQGSNGVILITTKRAKAGKDALSVSFNSGINKASRVTPMMNTAQYLAMRKEAVANSQVTPSELTDPDLTIFDQERYVNWMKEFYGGTARRTDLHLSLSGGSLATTYLLSGGYTRDTYNFPGDMVNARYSIHSAFSHKSRNLKFKLDFGTDFSYEDNGSSREPGVLLGFTLAPNFPDLLDATGKPVWSYKGYQFGGYQGNPLAATKREGDNGTYYLNSYIQSSYEVMRGLKVGLMAGYSRTSENFYAGLPIYTQNPAYMPTGMASFGNRNTDLINIVPQVDYIRTIGKAQISAVIGGTYKKNYSAGTALNGYGYTSDALLNSIAGASSMDASNTGSYYKYINGFGRFNFRWNDKYIINLTANRDGSSNFGPNKQFGSFGSAGAGWILSEEKWFSKLIPVLSFTKLSASYGTTGSDGVAPYQYQANWRRGGSNAYQGLPGYNPANPLNPEYAWATNKKFTQQLDLGFFADRLMLNFAVYQNSCANQLVSYLQPIQTGFGSVLSNAPYIVKNNGWELTLTSKNLTGKGLSWTTNLNLFKNRNRLASFPNIALSPYASYYVVGKSLLARQLVPFAGVNAETGIFEFYKADGTKTNFPGIYSGFNNVGGDLTQMVDLAPKLQGGLTNTFTWKGLTLSFLLQFTIQDGPNYLRSIYSGPGAIPGTPLVNQPLALLEDLWHKPGDKAITQRLNSGFSGTDGFKVYAAAAAFTSSTGAYSDASYIRVKNVSLSYNLPEKWMRKMVIKGCSIYANAQNLFLITGYKFGDPETLNIYTIPPQRTVVMGINANF